MITLNLLMNERISIYFGTDADNVTITLSDDQIITEIIKTFESHREVKQFMTTEMYQVNTLSSQNASIYKILRDMLNMDHIVFNGGRED